jgi:hypothetical protein
MPARCLGVFGVVCGGCHPGRCWWPLRHPVAVGVQRQPCQALLRGALVGLSRRCPGPIHGRGPPSRGLRAACRCGVGLYACAQASGRAVDRSSWPHAPPGSARWSAEIVPPARPTWAPRPDSLCVVGAGNAAALGHTAGPPRGPLPLAGSRHGESGDHLLVLTLGPSFVSGLGKLSRGCPPYPNARSLETRCTRYLAPPPLSTLLPVARARSPTWNRFTPTRVGCRAVP